MSEPIASADDQMSHGHSRLTWLLDDIEAHIQGLREGSEEPELILEELTSFVRAFSDELDGHIEEEETDIFPRASALARDDERDELAELDREHRLLEAQMRRFWETLSRAAEETSRGGNGTCFEELSEQVSSIREHLTEHSSHERAFLTRVEARSRETPPRSH